jgi:N-acetyl sugar amidotransferase
MSSIKTMYGLPEQVVFCKNCVMSNQRPASAQEHKHVIDSKKTTLNINSDGICDACKTSDLKQKIDWVQREKELIDLCNKYRKNDGSYDCLVPGSGGKDSAYQAHILKYKYGMNPLTVTWPPILYTDYGFKNFKNWLDIGGFDNLSFNRNGKVMKLLTKLSIENLFHPFQTFILGQKNLAPKIASKYGIDLIFYGENEAEYGNPIADNSTSLRDKSYFTYNNLNEIYLGGISVNQLIEDYDLRVNDLMSFLPLDAEELDQTSIQVHYLGYYLKWLPQEAFYYAVENTGFKPRPFRTQGTYSKYNSIDDKIDDLHYYTTFIKFGIGRATYDASQEIRNNHLTRDEGKALVDKFDGEFPDRYFEEIMDYLGIDSEYFKGELTDKFRSPHLWKNTNEGWKLRHTVNLDGTDD